MSGNDPFGDSVVKKSVINKIAEQKGLDPKTLTMETNLVSIGLDSLDMVELSLDLEDAFGITINQNDIAGIKTLGQAVEFVERNKKS